MRIDNDLWDFWDRQLSSMREEYSRSPAQRDLDELLIALSRGAVYCKTVDAPAALENSLELDHTGAALVKDYRFRIYAADEILRQAAVQPENFFTLPNEASRKGALRRVGGSRRIGNKYPRTSTRPRIHGAPGAIRLAPPGP